MNHLVTKAEALCRVLVPELAHGPVYVVLRSGLSQHCGDHDGPDGCTVAHLDLMLRPTLERQGRWSGRGPAMLIDPATIASGAARRPRRARRRAFIASVFGVVLHELAHVLDSGPLETEPPAGFVEAGRAMLTAELDGTAGPTNGPGAAIPWRGHEWAFLRIALHLAHRAAVLGVALAPLDVFDATAYGLSPIQHYADALGDEPARLADSTINTLEQTPPPSAFADLWLADVRVWMNRPDAHNEIATMLARRARRISVPHA